MYHSSWRQGFTIVELLIVIVVIGILAAIVIVAYSGVQNKANDVAVQADLRTIAGKMMEFQLTNATNSYPTATQADLQALIKVNKNAYFTGPAGTMSYCRSDTGFTLLGRSRSKQAYVYSSANGLASVAFNGNLTSQCGLGGVSSSDAGFDKIMLLVGTDSPPSGWLGWL